MKNHLYSAEMVSANKYLKSIDLPADFNELVKELQSDLYIHSDRWSIAFDYFEEHNLDINYVTGFVYSIED